MQDYGISGKGEFDKANNNQWVEVIEQFKNSDPQLQNDVLHLFALNDNIIYLSNEQVSELLENSCEEIKGKNPYMALAENALKCGILTDTEVILSVIENAKNNIDKYSSFLFFTAAVEACALTDQKIIGKLIIDEINSTETPFGLKQKSELSNFIAKMIKNRLLTDTEIIDNIAQSMRNSNNNTNTPGNIYLLENKVCPQGNRKKLEMAINTWLSVRKSLKTPHTPKTDYGNNIDNDL